MQDNHLGIFGMDLRFRFYMGKAYPIYVLLCLLDIPNFRTNSWILRVSKYLLLLRVVLLLCLLDGHHFRTDSCPMQCTIILCTHWLFVKLPFYSFQKFLLLHHYLRLKIEEGYITWDVLLSRYLPIIGTIMVLL